MAGDFSTRIDQHFASLTDPRRGKESRRSWNADI